MILLSNQIFSKCSIRHLAATYHLTLQAGTALPHRHKWIYTILGTWCAEKRISNDLRFGSGEVFHTYSESTLLLILFLAQEVVFIQHGKQSHLHWVFNARLADIQFFWRHCCQHHAENEVKFLWLLENMARNTQECTPSNRKGMPFSSSQALVLKVNDSTRAVEHDEHYTIKSGRFVKIQRNKLGSTYKL